MVSLREVAEYTDATYRVAGSVPPDLLPENRRGFLTLLRHGKEWAFEHMLAFQPRTSKQLLSGSEFHLSVKRATGGLTQSFYLEVQGRVISLNRQLDGSNPGDADYQSRIDILNRKLSERDGHPVRVTERHLSLPEPIRMAYYCRFDGMGVPDSPAFGAFERILPYPIGRPWQSIDGYLSDLRLKKKLLPVVEEMIPGIRPDERDMPYTNFMMFLNSWGSFVGDRRTDGDHLFVKNHIQDGVVYYVRDADVHNMTVLANPVEAIDCYCEHVLMRKEGRFDFRPWSVPLN